MDKNSNQKYKYKDLFILKPGKWGLRGDPYLWDEMNALIGEEELPTNKNKFKKTIIQLFEKIVERKLRKEKPFYMEQFANGGMSSGMICPEAWLENMIPHLLENYKRLTDNKKE